MERDFMGLSSKEPLAMVKKEIFSDGCQEIGLGKGSERQWSFSNKVTAYPHFMPFQFTHEEKPRKSVLDSLVPPGFKPILASEAYDGSHRRSTTEIQAFQLLNQAISVPINNPFSKNHISNIGQCSRGLKIKQQLPIGGIPVSTSHSILPFVAGTNGPCVKTEGCLPQLTIFYGGTVSVYNDISQEKAQAIMLLAGSGSSMALNSAQPRGQVSTPISKPAAVNCGTASQPINAPPVSACSHTGAKSGSGSTSTPELMTAKTTGVAAAQHGVNAMGSVSTNTILPSGRSNFYTAIPQARKASLALFLEKRKQRVMNAAPYKTGKKSAECDTIENGSLSASKEGTVI